MYAKHPACCQTMLAKTRKKYGLFPANHPSKWTGFIVKWLLMLKPDYEPASLTVTHALRFTNFGLLIYWPFSNTHICNAASRLLLTRTVLLITTRILAFPRKFYRLKRM